MFLLPGLLAGCDDLGGYATRPGEAYVGSVVGVEDPPVLRRGFAAETRLSMTFDPQRADSTATPPGTVTTSDGSLTDVVLEPIAPLTHDALSDYEIPTEGPLAGREPMAFVSLMRDGRVEVRVIAGTGSRDGDYFGLWRLTLEEI